MYGRISDPGPGCDGTSTLSRGATLAPPWLHEPQPIINRSVGLAFPHSTPYGAVSTRGMSVFVPGLFESYVYGNIDDPVLGPYRPHVRRDLNVFARDNTGHALVLGALPIRNQPLGVFFHTLRGGIDRGMSDVCFSLLAPGLLEL